VATVGNLLVLISGSNAPLTAALAKSEGELKAFSATAGGHGATAAGHFHGVGVAALGVVGAVGIMGAAGIKAAGDFQEQMAIINTIAHQTPAELDKTGEAIRADGGPDGDEPLTDLTKAFYDLLSAGVARLEGDGGPPPVDDARHRRPRHDGPDGRPADDRDQQLPPQRRRAPRSRPTSSRSPFRTAR
jgi:hypothetical protein